MFSDMSVRLIDFMGSDLTVVNAARVSFAKHKTEFDEKDARLISYLARHAHWTPFAHCFATFRIKAPIFVARQLGKHQVGLVWNEVSRRYVDSEPEFYIPDEWRSRPEGGVKQGSGAPVSAEMQQRIKRIVHYFTANATAIYKDLIAEGIAPEQARMILPQNMMTEWYWSGSLVAFARVCKLRLDVHAQKETAEVAQEIAALLEAKFPVSWKALMEN